MYIDFYLYDNDFIKNKYILIYILGGAHGYFKVRNIDKVYDK